MNGERLLLDTVFVQGLLNQRDEYHAQARAILPNVAAHLNLGRKPPWGINNPTIKKSKKDENRCHHR
jgi:hypothetical protein